MAIRYFRRVYGKVVFEPSGPVEAGFEHKVTSVSQGFPVGIITPILREGARLHSCDPLERVEETAKRSTRELVHETAQRRGAFFLLPVRCKGRFYMTATCIRARSEQGETDTGAVPGRPYTQSSLYVFGAEDWRRHAPWLAAGAPHWLLTEPDLSADFYDGNAPEPETMEPGPERFPFHKRPFPAADSPVWRMLAGLERRDTPALFGAGRGIGSETAFWARLAEALALLPESLRLLVTVAGNIAQPHPGCAIQYIPGPLLEDWPSPEGSSWFDLLRADHPALAKPQAEEPADIDALEKWRNEIGQHLSNDRLDQWQTPGDAQIAFANALLRAQQRMSVRELQLYLLGERGRPAPPKSDVAPSWIIELDAHLRAFSSGSRSGTEIANGTRLPGPTPWRAVRIAAGLNGRDWAQAWALAAQERQAADPTQLQLLAWSALRGALDGDGEYDGLAIGSIPGFEALAPMLELKQRFDFYKQQAVADPFTPDAADASPFGISDCPDPFGQRSGFRERLRALQERAAGMLAAAPDQAIVLAKTFPQLIVGNRAAGEMVLLIDEAVSGLREAGDAAPERGYDGHRLNSIQRAVGTLAEVGKLSQLQLGKPEMLERFLQHGLQASRDSPAARTFWLGAFKLRSAELGLSDLLRLLLATAAVPIARGDPEQLDRIFEDLVRARCAADKPQHVAFALAELCAADQGRRLLEHRADNSGTDLLATHMREALLDAVRRADPVLLQDRFIPVFGRLLQNSIYVQKEENDWLGELARALFARLIKLGPDGRGAVLALLDHIEEFAKRIPHADQPAYWALIERAIQSWAKGPKPYLEPVVKGQQTILRRQLAQFHSFPRCLYRGRLWEKDDLGQSSRLDYEPPLNEPARSFVIARCAVPAWRKEFANEKGKRTLTRWFESAYKSTQDEALAAIATAVRQGSKPVLSDLGADIVYVVSLLDLLNPKSDKSVQDAANAKLLVMPDDLREDVLQVQPNEATTLGYWLAGLLVRKGRDVGAALLHFIKEDPNQAITIFRAEMLIRPRSTQGASSFDNADDSGIAHRLDRILFVWRLFADARNLWKARQDLDAGDFARKVFKLPEDARPRMKRFFEHGNKHRQYRHAISNLQGEQYLGKLLGWSALSVPTDPGE